MRDFTLRFSDKADFRAFLRKLNWEEDEELQNAVGKTGYTVLQISREPYEKKGFLGIFGK